MKQNSVIYEPDYIILDNELLTSLCIYFDELILVSNHNIDDELCKIKDEKKENYKEKADYIGNTLIPLTKEGIVTLYDADEIFNICPKSSYTELGQIEVDHTDYGLHLNIKSLNDNEITKAMLEKISTGKCTAGELARIINVYTLSMEYNIPIIKKNVRKVECSAQSLSDLLAIKTLCKLALPQINSTNVEDIIKVRKELQDELLEFRAGILDITYLLYQSMKSTPKEIIDINQEMNMLIDTKIQSAIISLEHKLVSNKKKRFPNIILHGGKFIISGALLALGLGDTVSTLNNSHSFLQSISDMESLVDKPEDKIASYIVSLDRHF